MLNTKMFDAVIMVYHPRILDQSHCIILTGNDEISSRLVLNSFTYTIDWDFREAGKLINYLPILLPFRLFPVAVVLESSYDRALLVDFA